MPKCLLTSSVCIQTGQFIVSFIVSQQLRLNGERYKSLLDQRAKQFRAIQRRLLTRFKDKTPAPLANLDTLLDGTYRQVSV